jgi:AraC-like DNA-binding protein
VQALDYTELICALAVCIEQHIKAKPDYRVMERVTGFSYHHIRDVFQRVTNISLSRYILARKVAHTAFEIRHSKKSITDIAFEYEFSNLETFTRAFRRDTGLTPSAFRKSSHLCGRKIIFPGVYAPVILDIKNPRFILPKLKEVNEMAEMTKTQDSCILYGVPKVYFGREVDGAAQGSPFPMCLQAVLNYMGQNIGYGELMAYSGAAFRQRWDSTGWNIAAVDVRFIYEHHSTPFERAFRGAGRSFKISENSNMIKSINKIDATALIKTELDCGRPVIALGVVGPPEACIVTGYWNNGETLLGWSLFQDFWGGCDFDESGYFIKNNWWEETEMIMTVGEEIGERASDLEVLQNALMLMTTEEMGTYGGNDLFYGGKAAYEAWAKALEDESFICEGDVEDCQSDAENMLHEGRYYAADFMALLAQRHTKLSKELKECAKHLKAASDCVPQMRKLREAQDLNNQKTRHEIAALIRQAAKHEENAYKTLKEAILKMSR